MSYRTVYVLAALAIMGAMAIVQFAQHLPAALERHAEPAELAVGVKDMQPEW